MGATIWAAIEAGVPPSDKQIAHPAGADKPVPRLLRNTEGTSKPEGARIPGGQGGKAKGGEGGKGGKAKGGKAKGNKSKRGKRKQLSDDEDSAEVGAGSSDVAAIVDNGWESGDAAGGSEDKDRQQKVVMS
ncbi:hypothetical protein OEZ85_003857 [Tetradesmus obliquus]|uniref:Uncharacterized protein n=1 Tax=Tetradesmus obliquus TaxID=3088 RepID=A0ABY8UGF2_TETOB|nr:hypothetical protein OEZ85_003857 [Tetradesmus obliquus]